MLIRVVVCLHLAKINLKKGLPDAFLKTVVEKNPLEHGCFGKNFICMPSFIFISSLLLQMLKTAEKPDFARAPSPTSNTTLSGT